MKYVAVYITTSTLKEARKISRILLEKRLVACTNIIPKIESSYWWKGNIQHENEVLIIGKTRSGLEDKIIETVKKHHSYAAPCVNFLPITEGNNDYFKWLREETGKSRVV